MNEIGTKQEIKYSPDIENAIREGFILELMQHQPEAVVGMIARGTLNSLDKKALTDFYENRIFQEGIEPAGEDYQTVCEILKKASVISGGPDLSTLREDWQLNEVGKGSNKDTYCSVVPGQGLVINYGKSPTLSKLHQFSIDRLLLGLWAAGCRSKFDRLKVATKPGAIAEVRYLHDDGTATIIKMDKGKGNRLATLMENAIVKRQGKF